MSKNTTNYHPIAKRNVCGDALGARNFKINIRVNRLCSKRLASIQGLCFSHGKRESLGWLFENVCMQALDQFAKKYAQKAARMRQDRSKERGR